MPYLTTKQKQLFIFLLISLLVTIVYYPSFSVPFYFDDFPSLVNNYKLHQSSFTQLISNLNLRSFGYFTFWLNFKLFGLDLTALHITNLLIHLMNGGLIYSLIVLLGQYFKLPTDRIKLIALLTCVIWLLHPLNIQAVTYIVQRFASLVTIFYLLSFISYLKFRMTNQYQWLYLFGFAAFLGVITKQNFMSVFVLIFLFENVFIRDKFSKALLIAFTVSIFVFITVYLISPEQFNLLDKMTRENFSMSRLDYFMTQTIVTNNYLIKLFIPLNLQLDMFQPLITDHTMTSYLTIVGNVALLVMSLLYRDKNPLLCFAVIFYFCAHMIESGFIPITDLAFEHRTYLPNIGLTLAVISLLFSVNNAHHKIKLAAVALVVCILAVLTFKRNIQWQSPEQFYTNEVKLSPDSPRSLAQIASIKAKKGYHLESEALYKKAIQLNFKAGKIAVSDINNLVLVLIKLKKYQQAIKTELLALKYIKKRPDISKSMTTLASIYIEMKQCQLAIPYLKKSIRFDQYNQKAVQLLQYCGQSKPSKND